MADKVLTFHVSGYSGIDQFINMVLSGKSMAKRIAKKLLRAQYKDWDPTSADLLLMLPEGTFRVVDRKGNVEVSKPDSFSSQGLVL